MYAIGMYQIRPHMALHKISAVLLTADNEILFGIKKPRRYLTGFKNIL